MNTPDSNPRRAIREAGWRPQPASRLPVRPGRNRREVSTWRLENTLRRLCRSRNPL